MRFAATSRNNVLTLAVAENCDTDSWPLVREVFFRRYQGQFDPEVGAVAAAILFSPYCGWVAEFQDARIGADAARAIRRVVPDVEDVLPVDGKKREIGQGSGAIAVGEAGQMYSGALDPRRLPGPTRALTWSGDFIAAGERDSTRHVGGDVFTNAALVATATCTSVALALLAGGRNLRDIYVAPPPAAEEAGFAAMVAALETIGVGLRTLDRAPA